MTRALHIIDENGNLHGPFSDHDEMMLYVESRALGYERDADDESGRGWVMVAGPAARTAERF